jgi:hypothetical protein
MSITIIKGPNRSGKSMIAAALRNTQITNKHGCLLVDYELADIKAMLEKILIGVSMPMPAEGKESLDPAVWQKLPWKPNSMVILVGDKVVALEKFEKLLPGFTKFFGPIYTIETSGGVEE